MGFEKDGKGKLEVSQCAQLAASATTSPKQFKERHAQVLEMWEQGRCYSPLGLFYSSVRDNYDPRSEGTVSEETELEQVVRRATRLMQHQSQQGDEEGSIDEEVTGNGAAVRAACSENGQVSSKGTYPKTKTSSFTRTSSSRASSTIASLASESQITVASRVKPTIAITVPLLMALAVIITVQIGSQALIIITSPVISPGLALNRKMWRLHPLTSRRKKNSQRKTPEFTNLSRHLLTK